MYITITTNAGTQTAEVANTESGLYERSENICWIFLSLTV